MNSNGKRKTAMITAILAFTLLQCASADFEEWYKRYSKHMTMYKISKEESKRAYIENVKFITDFNSANHSYTLSTEGRWVGFPRAKLSSIFRKRSERLDKNRPKRGNVTFSYNTQCLEYYDNDGHVDPSIFPSDPYSYPDSVDWRDQMSPIRDQGSCGGCYTFGSIGALEGRLNIMKNYKFDLSEQQMLDCTKDYGNNGCGGGLGGNVYNYLRNNDLAYEYDYPYQGSSGQCKTGFPTHVSLKTYKCGLTAMRENLANGPVDIAMYVDGSFMYYSSGYYTGQGDGCTNNVMQTNHEMVAVGYGRHDDKLYYIIRNSWGTSWGMSGYAYVYDHVCSVSTDPEVPVLYTVH